MREQFENLPRVKPILRLVKYHESSDGYDPLDQKSIYEKYADWLNGAWYTFQEQQEKIARLQSALDDLKKTCNDVLDLGVSDEFERGWGCAHRRVLCRIEAIIGADK